MQEATQGREPRSPTQAERAVVSAFRWGHITRAQAAEKLGGARALQLLGARCG